MNLRVERCTIELVTGEFIRNERYPAKAFLHLQSIGFMVTPQFLIAPKYGLRVTRGSPPYPFTDGSVPWHSACYRGVCTTGKEAGMYSVS